MQIKTFLLFHLTSVQMIKINTSEKCWQICGEREPLFTVGGNTDWSEEYSKYLKNVCYDPDIPSSVCSQRSWCIKHRYLLSIIHCHLIP